jgi:hypothetical protein
MKKVAILQSNYIPWKGYFDMINMVDLFIFHDDLQYTHGDWRNRNLIKTSSGVKWLTIPCGTSEKRLIHEVELNTSFWQKDHWNLILQSYRKAKYFKTYRTFFEEIYLGTEWKNLSTLNQYLIKNISKEILGINHVEFDDSRNYNLVERKADRVKELLLKSKAETYLSGPAAKAYLPENFMENNIDLKWMDYSGYPEYNQQYPPFVHNVSIIDLIFNEGENSLKYMKSFNVE